MPRTNNRKSLKSVFMSPSWNKIYKTQPQCSFFHCFGMSSQNWVKLFVFLFYFVGCFSLLHSCFLSRFSYWILFDLIPLFAVRFYYQIYFFNKIFFSDYFSLFLCFSGEINMGKHCGNELSKMYSTVFLCSGRKFVVVCW